MLFQDHNLFPHLTLAQNLGLGLSPRLRLTQAEAKEENPEVKECLTAALGVLQGAGLNTLRTQIRRVCGDEIEREKLFGVPQPQ
jgi:ABC-type thiamine transport system ATPase subunit